MWGAFWANCVGQKCQGLSVAQRCRLLDRTVKPVLSFRHTRWSWSKSLADAQNKTQRQMLAFFVHLERWPDEDAAGYNRRRMRAIGSLARQHGTWGEDHARRVVDWAQHLLRERNSRSLASQLYRWHDAKWLQ